MASQTRNARPRGTRKTDPKENTFTETDDDWVTIVPMINIGLSDPDVPNAMNLYKYGHALYETTKDIKIPKSVAQRLFRQGKACPDKESYDACMKHPGAYRDPELRAIIKKQEQ